MLIYSTTARLYSVVITYLHQIPPVPHQNLTGVGVGSKEDMIGGIWSPNRNKIKGKSVVIVGYCKNLDHRGCLAVFWPQCQMFNNFQ